MLNPTPTRRVYRFGAFELDPRTGELTNAGVRVPLREQPLQLLLALLARPGDLVTREELRARLWPDGTFVDFDRGLNKAINHLRDALGDSSEQPQFVETLPRKGYRFIAKVSLEGDETTQAAGPDELANAEAVSKPPAQKIRLAVIAAGLALAAVLGFVLFRTGWLNRRAHAGRISAIAVLPLENLSHDPEQEYFADGMTDELITNLAKLGGAHVISRTSAMRYKGTRKTIGEIGRELNVDAIVEGTVLRSGDRVRITAQLIQVSTDMHLWAEAYERDLSQVLDLQNDVATEIARRINTVVKPQEQAQTVNPRAYGFYLRGRYFFFQYTSDGWQKAIDQFNQAIQIDPRFAPAYSGLAGAYLVAGAYQAIPIGEALTRGKAAAEAALALDPSLASAHYALATAYVWYDWDWRKAESEYQRGLELDPNDALGRNWYGGYLSLVGRHDQAVQEQVRARELDPFSLITNANLARSYYWARRFDEAIVQGRNTLKLNPGFGVALFWLEASLRHRGLTREAVALRQMVGTPERAKAIQVTFESRGFNALLLENAEGFKKSGALVEAARCFAQVGEKSQALALLESCYERRCSSMVMLKAEPDFDVLHEEPRFQELVRKMGLT